MKHFCESLIDLIVFPSTSGYTYVSVTSDICHSPITKPLKVHLAQFMLFLHIIFLPSCVHLVTVLIKAWLN